MELEIVDSSGVPQESILSITSGGTRRQVKLVSGARARFPDSALTSTGKLKDDTTLKVDIHARVGSEKVVVEKDKDMYELVFDGEMGLKLKMTPVVEEQGSTRKKIADAQAADAYIGQHDLIKMAEENDRSDNSGLPEEISTAGLSQEELEKHNLTIFAKDYIERHKLRQFLQGMFQNIIREKPEDPYGFMQDALEQVQPPQADKSSGGNFRKGKYTAPAAAGDEKPPVGLTEQNGQFFFTIGVDSPEGLTSPKQRQSGSQCKGRCTCGLIHSCHSRSSSNNRRCNSGSFSTAGWECPRRKSDTQK
jgi:hypothetical protein